MVLSQREKTTAIILGAVLALVIFYEVVYSPLSSWSDDIADQKVKADQTALANDTLFHKQKKLNAVWRDMLHNGLKSTPGEAQSQLQHAVAEWAAQAHVAIASEHTDNAMAPDVKTGFIPVTYQVTCNGNTSAIARMLYQIESASIPIRIDSLDITSRKDGTDDLEIQLNLSTLCVPATAKKPDANAVAAGAT